MQTNRIVTGMGTGALHDFRWAVSVGIPDYIISPVAIYGSLIAATATSVRDGVAHAVLVENDEIFRELEGGTYVVAGAPNSVVVGLVGYGHGAFKLKLDGDRFELAVPKGATTVDIDCVNSVGDVGGSITVRGEECAVVWRSGECDVLPRLRRITALSESGLAYGQDHDGSPVRLFDGETFGGRGTVVGVNELGDALVNSADSILIWKADGGVEAVAIRGYVRISALGWSNIGTILGFGITSGGVVQHWLFDQKIGLRVLTDQVLEGDLVIKDVGAIGAEGELAGTASNGTERFLVRLY